jgi:hypothetical protein
MAFFISAFFFAIPQRRSRLSGEYLTLGRYSTEVVKSRTQRAEGSTKYTEKYYGLCDTYQIIMIE